MESIYKLTYRQILLLVGLVSSAVLSGALIGQYFFDLHPCHLCILQRWLYAAVTLLAFAGAFFSSSSDKKLRIILMICATILLIGAGIASYHAGVEMGILKGPDSCSADPASNLSLEELRAQIAGAALVSCTQAMAYIFGLSMAAWNALISIATIGFIAICLKGKKREQVTG